MDKKAISSDRSIARYKPKDKQYTVKVDGCKRLFMVIRPDTPKTKNRKSWQYRFKSPVTSKTATISLGEYPQVSLSEVRKKWIETEELLNKGIDPQIYKKDQKEAQLNAQKNTFEYFAWLHFDSLQNSEKESTLKRKKARYQLLCDYIGNYPIDSIDAPKMLEVLQDIQHNSLNSKGKPTDKAERCAGIASKIFVYAIARGHCSSDPASMIKSQLDSYEYNHRPAIIEPNDFAKLLRIIDSGHAPPNTLNSLRLLSLLFVRNGDLRHAKWSDIKLDEAKWDLKPMKGRGKEKMVKRMVIPLSDQALAIFKEQYELNGHTEYVFYSSSARANDVISENTAGYFLNSMGYQGIHCPHGFRASAKTILQEHLKYQAVYVEMALGHITKDQNGTAYGRFTFLDERKKMMQEWADYLDKIKTNNGI